jgi:hypothetical protein
LLLCRYEADGDMHISMFGDLFFRRHYHNDSSDEDNDNQL